MNSWRWNINAIFFAAILAALFSGCKTTEEKKADKEQTLIYFHIEAMRDNPRRSIRVPIYRANPQIISINEAPFLDNGSILEAAVVDVEGGFAIRIAFDQHGQMVLENVTANHPGRRIAVNAAFPEVRWLAAPPIKRRLSDGSFIFTPDATREEAERIVRGINNLNKSRLRKKK